MTIKSPYNFVPLSDKVVFPDWGKDVSHDIPFEDGISGKIELEIKLESDAYIRNGGKWDDKTKNDNPDYQKFFTAKVNGEKKYIIPGTSFKGMIRNVLEIASFGKMQKINGGRYSLRDLSSKDKDLYTGRLSERTETKAIRSKAEAGWLVQKGEEWCIIPCDYARVEQQKLGEYFGTRRENAVDKYKHYKRSLDIWFEPVEAKDYQHSCGFMNYKKIVDFSEQKKNSNQVKGRLVFTGQPSPRVPGKNKRKHMEFVFYNEKKEKIDVTELKKDFEFIHSDANGIPNKEWEYWKTKLENGERVPVFFLDDENYEFSFGLAMMFRLPYDYSVEDLITYTNNDHLDKQRHDMAELIFGYVEDNKPALRGRVQFSHFVSDDAVKTELINVVLGSPKASYYPNYIVQDSLNKGHYKTFMDGDAEISGWKRYPAEKNQTINYKPELPKDPKTGKINWDVVTKFIPLKAGSTFKGSLRFFNLRPVELGALLWALDFGGNKNCQHKIGMGKPLGLGRISIALKCDGIDCKRAVDAFEKYMAENVPDWKNSKQIKELIAMSDVNLCLSPDLREYPKLSKPAPTPAKPNNTENEFVEYKKKYERLEPYSKNAKEVK